MNNVSLVGRLTRDPELKYTLNNQAVTTFTLAINRTFKNANGEREADFINIVAWRNSADFICKYFKKGSEIAVIGRLQTRNYDDKDGKKVYVTEVIAEQVSFTGGSKQNTNQPNQQAPKNNGATGNVDPFRDSGNIALNDDDLPF
jgi:single-strand DNA-binding protein